MTDQRRDWRQGHRRLVLDACEVCGHVWYLPREHCPRCGSPDARMVPSHGVGTCVATTRMHAKGDEAGAERLCLVELDEGPLVLGQVDDRLQPGERAALDFQTADVLVPYFSRKAC